MNDSGFNSRLISNAKRLFSETVSPKTHVQIFLDKKCYHRALIFSFTATPPYITTATHIGEQIYSSSSNMRNCFATKLFYHLVLLTRKISLQKWIISHPHVIQYPISNDYITVQFCDGNGGVKTDIRLEVTLQVSVRGLYLDVLKIFHWVFHFI